MNNGKDFVEAGCKTIIKDLARSLPLGSTAVEIYEKLQSKQIERKIQRFEEFYSDFVATVNAVEDKINQEYNILTMTISWMYMKKPQGM